MSKTDPKAAANESAKVESAEAVPELVSFLENHYCTPVPTGVEPFSYVAARQLQLTRRLESRDEAIRADERRRIVEYIATHYPVHVTGGRGPSRWEMEETSDGGRIQSTYAEAIKALR